MQSASQHYRSRSPTRKLVDNDDDDEHLPAAAVLLLLLTTTDAVPSLVWSDGRSITQPSAAAAAGHACTNARMQQEESSRVEEQQISLKGQQQMATAITNEAKRCARLTSRSLFSHISLTAFASACSHSLPRCSPLKRN